MSKNLYSDYFNEYTVDSWSYSNKPDFKILINTGDEILFGEVKPKDSSSVSMKKKDSIKLADFQVGALNELIW
ncbi:1652_t:CDS:1, partial [Entrophospora sp. SA101]